VLSTLCMKLDGVGDGLVRPQRGLHKLEWPDTHEVEFHLGHGEWIEVLATNGFAVERLIELFAPQDAETHTFYSYVTPEWGSKWPVEDLWVARKRG
jgi:hypothetical protein